MLQMAIMAKSPQRVSVESFIDPAMLACESAFLTTCKQEFQLHWSALPPLSMLRAFEAAARCGGFSAAGRELNVTHAAVAQQVRGLEERLGTQLLRRDGRGLAPTPEGRRLAERLGEALAIMRDGVAEVIEAGAERPVRITLSTGFAAGWLTHRLGEFRAERPDVELMLNPTATLIDLPRSDFDFAIRYGRGDWKGVEVERLFVSPGVVVGAPDLVARVGIETPADLLRAPWVQELGVREWSVWLAARDVTVGEKRDVLHLPAHMALDALRAGQGVGLMTRLLVERDIADGALVALFDDEAAAPGAGYWLVRRPGPLRESAAAFAGWLRREAAKG
ncbi:MAG: LysR family transcriptional regulator [Rhodobacteraceae bacterium]|nr:MAG: LysR family transcriptional regulator [Paracoccaceae bacterium]